MHSLKGDDDKAFVVRIGHSIWRYVKWLLGLNILYGILLVSSFCIPQTLIEQNRVQSMAIMNGEGDYPVPLYGAAKLDNFTDNLVMMKLLSPFSGSSVVHAFDVYSRYWNGWVVFLRPMLVFCNINTIRVFQSGLFVVLLCTVCILLCKRLGYMFALLFVLALLPCRLDLVAISMQFSHVFWIFLLAVAWLCLKRRSVSITTLSFFVVGSVTNYVDLLTVPLLTLMVPLVVAVALQYAYGVFHLRRIVVSTICWGVSWGMGYGLTWVMKWIISTLVTQQNVIADGLNNAARRSHGKVEISLNNDYTLVGVLKKMCSQFVYRGDMYLYALIMLAIIVGGVYYAIHHRQFMVFPEYSMTVQSRIIYTIINCCVAFLPVAWVLVFTQHSLIHSWFVYRLLSGSLLCIFGGIWYWIPRQGLCNSKDTAERAKL